jgi:hypothetical protein
METRDQRQFSTKPHGGSMAIHLITSDAASLLKEFDARIDQKEDKGKITTWERTDDGNYYTHKASDWNKKAWFRPKIETNQLTFNIIKPKNDSISMVVYAYYHGHLLETFLNHFDKSFIKGIASALPEADDNVSSK